MRVLRLLVGLIMLGALLTTTAAQAAVPDRKAWVLWNQSTLSTIGFGTGPPGTTVTPLAPPGRYQIRFPGQATSFGIVHVTAINQSPHWCQAETWGPSGVDELVFIRCHRPGGAISPTSFSAFFTRSSGLPSAGPYGYVDSQASGALISQYNSVGAPNSSVNTGVGQWHVRFPGIVTGGPMDGGLQATAVNTAVGARCKVAAWSSNAGGQDVRVWCFNAAGAPLNTRFTLTYQHKVSLYGATMPPKYHGYYFFPTPFGPAPPPTTNFNSVFGFGANTVMAAGPGLWLVTFPRLGVPQNTVQVTAHGPNSNFCGLLTFWGNPGDLVVRDVNCFTNAGAPVTTQFLIGASSIF